MKRILAGLLALAMMASTAVFASAEGENAITGISDSFYLVDDDGYVDLTRAADNVPYGETAYFPLKENSSHVADSKKVEKIKVSDKWEENGSYVGKVEVLRKRVSADSEKYLSGVSGNRLIYFLAIETEQKSATKDQDLFGRVTLKQTTGDKEYRFDEIAFDVAIELGYVSASKSEGEGIIPIKPASFSKRDGFEEESDYTFEFAAESNASFVVNTNGQGTIVLGMDIDFDDDIGDEYPTADLYFYNGNYAQFNRTGTLYLPGPSGDEGDYYVYAIDSKGRLSRVDAEWDEYEECYAIRTNILGRYVLSDEKLSTTSSSSGSSSASSSSGSEGGSGELVVVPPPSSTAPASSTTQPVSSSTAPRPSSTPPPSSSTPSSEPESSSEPEEESSEPESEPEEPESEPEEIIDVDTEPDDSDAPEKSGLGAFIWVLIIVALLAVAAAAGFVLYASRAGSSKKRRRSAPRSGRSRRRGDDYDDYDEEEYDEDDDYDDRDFRR